MIIGITLDIPRDDGGDGFKSSNNRLVGFENTNTLNIKFLGTPINRQFLTRFGNPRFLTPIETDLLSGLYRDGVSDEKPTTSGNPLLGKKLLNGINTFKPDTEFVGLAVDLFLKEITLLPVDVFRRHISPGTTTRKLHGNIPVCKINVDNPILSFGIPVQSILQGGVINPLVVIYRSTLLLGDFSWRVFFAIFGGKTIPDFIMILTFVFQQDVLIPIDGYHPVIGTKPFLEIPLNIGNLTISDFRRKDKGNSIGIVFNPKQISINSFRAQGGSLGGGWDGLGPAMDHLGTIVRGTFNVLFPLKGLEVKAIDGAIHDGHLQTQTPKRTFDESILFKKYRGRFREMNTICIHNDKQCWTSFTYGRSSVQQEDSTEICGRILGWR